MLADFLLLFLSTEPAASVASGSCAGGGGSGEFACRFSGFGEPSTDVWLAMLSVDAGKHNKFRYANEMQI